ncbi:MAG: HAMP domain-containing protein [Deltaproteobacteria bacterium]|nr:HAMP domain-containing protein [Deltaproteobacteria bacterium]MBN2671098.1 HAMP domain-containing protein [Deltaproteobacteria bacterium]
MRFSIKAKLVLAAAMALAATLALFINAMATSANIEEANTAAELRKSQMEDTMAFQLNVKKITLCAMDMIIDRQSGEVEAELMEEFNESKAILSKSLRNIEDNADTAEEKKLANQMSTDVEAIVREVETKMIPDVKMYAELKKMSPEVAEKKWDKLEQRFSHYDDSIDKVAGRVDAKAATYRASIEEEVKESIAENEQVMKRAKITNYVVLGVAVLILTLFFTYLAISITRPLKTANQYMAAIAQGDLRKDIVVDRNDEIGDMLNTLALMNKNLADMVTNVQHSAGTVSQGSQQIAVGAQDLSQRTQEQAASVEETTSTIEEMTATIKMNAENAQKAKEIAQSASALAADGGKVVESTIFSMEAVTDSAKKIADIVDMVNEIAFQTNLLALNAAVEAARAGEMGKGFAVVAKEVRSLAGRSGSAAKEIQNLINDSNQKIEGANKNVSESGDTLKAIIESINNVAITISEIAAANQEQSAGIDQVNKAVIQLDQAIQQNAALVEESSSASENLSSEAGELTALMAQFKTKTDQIQHGYKREPAFRQSPVRSHNQPVHTPVSNVSYADQSPKDFFDNSQGEVF